LTIFLLLQEAKEFEEEDKKVKERIDAKNSLESYIYNIKNTIGGQFLLPVFCVFCWDGQTDNEKLQMRRRSRTSCPTMTRRLLRTS
jgi:hypothetical protein